jgi:CoA-dependent NAD(P)H sulfur oxidoreductase
VAKVVVIGGNAAGMSAASQVKRQKPDWEVIVFEKGSYISYGACGIPYYVEGLVPGIDDLVTVTPAEAVSKRKLDLRMHHEVVAINPQSKKITYRSKDNKGQESFDYLVIATGARPLKTEIDYSPSDLVYTVHTLDDSQALRSFIDRKKPGKCAVIGGGYIALEMLEALHSRGIETHMIHRRTTLSRSFEQEVSDLTISALTDQGIIMKLNHTVQEIKASGNMVEVTTDQGLLYYDLVVVGAGVEPNSVLARECGIETGVRGSIRVSEYLQTNIDGIYAAGDCTETKNIVSGQPVFVPLALKANKEGVVAGVNISGGQEKFPGVLGTAITKFGNLGLARTGLTLAEAQKSGFDAFKFKVEANSRAHYYPGQGPMIFVLIADKKDGRLLGAQIAGPADSVKRIDVYATAIMASMNLDQIFHLDLAYAPPFSPVYDPVVLTGRVGRKLVKG